MFEIPAGDVSTAGIVSGLVGGVVLALVYVITDVGETNLHYPIAAGFLAWFASLLATDLRWGILAWLIAGGVVVATKAVRVLN
jgi:hypothetical protein